MNPEGSAPKQDIQDHQQRLDMADGVADQNIEEADKRAQEIIFEKTNRFQSFGRDLETKARALRDSGDFEQADSLEDNYQAKKQELVDILREMEPRNLAQHIDRYNQTLDQLIGSVKTDLTLEGPIPEEEQKDRDEIETLYDKIAALKQELKEWKAKLEKEVDLFTQEAHQDLSEEKAQASYRAIGRTRNSIRGVQNEIQKLQGRAMGKEILLLEKQADRAFAQGEFELSDRYLAQIREDYGKNLPDENLGKKVAAAIEGLRQEGKLSLVDRQLYGIAHGDALQTAVADTWDAEKGTAPETRWEAKKQNAQVDMLQQIENPDQAFRVSNYQSPKNEYLVGNKAEHLPGVLKNIHTQSGKTLRVCFTPEALEFYQQMSTEGKKIILTREPDDMLLTSRFTTTEKNSRAQVSATRHTRYIRFVDVIKPEDLATFQEKDGNVSIEHGDGNITTLDRKKVHQEGRRQAHNIMRSVEKSPSLNFGLRFASTINEASANFEKILGTQGSGGKREMFVKFAQREATTMVNTLNDPHTIENLKQAKAQIQKLREAGKGIVLTDQEAELLNKEKLIDQSIKLAKSDSFKHLFQTILDASQFDDDSWETWASQNLSTMVIAIATACLVIAVITTTVFSGGTAAPLWAVALGGATGGLIGQEAGAEITRANHHLWNARLQSGELNYSSRSLAMKKLTDTKIYNAKTGKYESLDWVSDVGTSYAGQLTIGFITNLATMGLGKIAGDKLAVLAKNSGLIKKIAGENPKIDALLKNVFKLNQASEAVKQCASMREIMKEIARKLPSEFGEEVGDEIKEKVLTDALNSIAPAIAVANQQIGLGSLAAFLLATGASTRAGISLDISRNTHVYAVNGNLEATIQEIHATAKDDPKIKSIVDMGDGMLKVEDDQGVVSFLRPASKTESISENDSTLEKASKAANQGDVQGLLNFFSQNDLDAHPKGEIIRKQLTRDFFRAKGIELSPAEVEGIWKAHAQVPMAIGSAGIQQDGSVEGIGDLKAKRGIILEALDPSRPKTQQNEIVRLAHAAGICGNPNTDTLVSPQTEITIEGKDITLQNIENLEQGDVLISSQSGTRRIVVNNRGTEIFFVVETQTTTKEASPEQGKTQTLETKKIWELAQEQYFSGIKKAEGASNATTSEPKLADVDTSETGKRLAQRQEELLTAEKGDVIRLRKDDGTYKAFTIKGTIPGNSVFIEGPSGEGVRCWINPRQQAFFTESDQIPVMDVEIFRKNEIGVQSEGMDLEGISLQVDTDPAGSETVSSPEAEASSSPTTNLEKVSRGQRVVLSTAKGKISLLYEGERSLRKNEAGDITAVYGKLNDQRLPRWIELEGAPIESISVVKVPSLEQGMEAARQGDTQALLDFFAQNDLDAHPEGQGLRKQLTRDFFRAKGIELSPAEVEGIWEAHTQVPMAIGSAGIQQDGSVEGMGDLKAKRGIILEALDPSRPKTQQNQIVHLAHAAGICGTCGNPDIAKVDTTSSNPDEGFETLPNGIEEVHPGDTFKVTLANGEVITYQVEEEETAGVFSCKVRRQSDGETKTPKIGDFEKYKIGRNMGGQTITNITRLKRTIDSPHSAEASETMTNAEFGSLLAQEQQKFETTSLTEGSSSLTAFTEHQGEMPQILEKYTTARKTSDRDGEGGREFLVGSEGDKDLYVYIPTKLDATPGKDLSEKKRWVAKSLALGRFAHMYQQKTDGVLRKNFTEPLGMVADKEKGQVYVVLRYDASVKNTPKGEEPKGQAPVDEIRALNGVARFNDSVIDTDGVHNVFTNFDAEGNPQFTFIDYESYGIQLSKPVEKGLGDLATVAEDLLKRHHPEKTNAPRLKRICTLQAESYSASKENQSLPPEKQQEIRALTREIVESFPQNDPRRPILDDLYNHILNQGNRTGKQSPQLREAVARWAWKNNEHLFDGLETLGREGIENPQPGHEFKITFENSEVMTLTVQEKKAEGVFSCKIHRSSDKQTIVKDLSLSELKKYQLGNPAGPYGKIIGITRLKGETTAEQESTSNPERATKTAELVVEDRLTLAQDLLSSDTNVQEAALKKYNLLNTSESEVSLSSAQENAQKFLQVVKNIDQGTIGLPGESYVGKALRDLDKLMPGLDMEAKQVLCRRLHTSAMNRVNQERVRQGDPPFQDLNGYMEWLLSPEQTITGSRPTIETLHFPEANNVQLENSPENNTRLQKVIDVLQTRSSRNDPLSSREIFDSSNLDQIDQSILTECARILENIDPRAGESSLPHAERWKILEFSARYLQDFRTADFEVDPQQLTELVCNNAINLAHQNIMDHMTLVGSSHGTLHILRGNSEMMLSLFNDEASSFTPRERVLALQATFDHDMGYTKRTLVGKEAGEGVFDASKDHPLESTLRVEALKDYYVSIFGKEGYQVIRDAVLDHSDPIGSQNAEGREKFKFSIDSNASESEKVGGVLALVDCLATVANLKASPLFRNNPEVIATMARIQGIYDQREALSQKIKSEPDLSSQETESIQGKIDRLTQDIKLIRENLYGRVQNMEGIDQKTKDSIHKALSSTMRWEESDFAIGLNLQMLGASVSSNLNIKNGKVNVEFSVDSQGLKTIRKVMGEERAEEISMKGILKAADDFGGLGEAEKQKLKVYIHHVEGLDARDPEKSNAARQYFQQLVEENGIPAITLITQAGLSLTINLGSNLEYHEVHQAVEKNLLLNKIQEYAKMNIEKVLQGEPITIKDINGKEVSILSVENFQATMETNIQEFIKRFPSDYTLPNRAENGLVEIHEEYRNIRRETKGKLISESAQIWQDFCRRLYQGGGRRNPLES